MRDACPDCGGDGKCAGCNGTGVNTHLNETEPKCQNCSGSGVCPACEGSGRAFSPGPEIQDIGLDQL